MTQLKRYGFFSDIPFDKLKDQLSRLVDKVEHINKKHILNYLRSGEGLIVVAGIVRDPLDPKRPIIGSPHILTDGIWAWTADVSFYVEKYNLHVPEEFVEEMQKNGWHVPRVSDPQSLEV